VLTTTFSRVNSTTENRHRAWWWLNMACAAIVWTGASGSANAQMVDPFLISSAPACVPGRITVPVVEWDLDTMGDLEPGAITVDVSSSSSDPTRVWFLTRQLSQHLYRLTLGRGHGSQAQFRSWELDASGGRFTGGLKKIRPSKDKRYVFVKTVETIQQVDTQCTTSGSAGCATALTTFRERIAPGDDSISDLALDDFNNVFTSAPFDEQTPGSYVQRLNPKATPDSAGFVPVTRWTVSEALQVGVCNQALSELGPCLSGVDLDDRNQQLVYFSNQGKNSIGELNTKATDTTKNLRYWSLDTLSAKLGLEAEGRIMDPRQLKVVREDGKTVVWVVTGSGHVVRLIPQTGAYGLMSAHRMPDAIEDPFGVAPDGGAIGYTSVGDSVAGDLADPIRKDKVGMLLPKDQLVQIPAVLTAAPVETRKILVTKLPLLTNTGVVDPDRKKVEGRVARNLQGDTFVDAFINRPTQPGDSPSFRPMGITPDYASKIGTFFYAVGITSTVAVNRIGRAFLPPAQRGKNARDDDDFDGDGKKNRVEDDDDDDDGTPNAMDRDNDNDCRDDNIDDNDDDDDGNDDKWDDPRKKETRTSASHTTAAGGSTDLPLIVPAGATLGIAQVTAADLATPLKVEIIGPTGVKLAAPLATPGVAVATVVPAVAGTYTVRVTNLGTTAASLTTDLIVQEAWPVLTSTLP
jgi:hypothetical protein